MPKRKRDDVIDDGSSDVSDVIGGGDAISLDGRKSSDSCHSTENDVNCSDELGDTLPSTKKICANASPDKSCFVEDKVGEHDQSDNTHDTSFGKRVDASNKPQSENAFSSHSKVSQTNDQGDAAVLTSSPVPHSSSNQRTLAALPSDITDDVVQDSMAAVTATSFENANLPERDSFESVVESLSDKEIEEDSVFESSENAGDGSMCVAAENGEEGTSDVTPSSKPNVAPCLSVSKQQAITNKGNVDLVWLLCS